MRITCLLENNAISAGIESEHGLSLYIETPDVKLLFDTGQSGLFVNNAATLGVNLKAIDAVILSHGHYDHGGGLCRFFEVNDKAVVYMSQDAFGDYFSKRVDGSMKYIGIDQRLKTNPRIVKVKGRYSINDRLTLFQNESNQYEPPIMNKYLFRMLEEQYVPDRFEHEINLSIHLEANRLLIAGCAHNGIENILTTYQQQEGCEPDVLIGGFHLSSGSRQEKVPPERVAVLGNYLEQINTSSYTCHCTGDEAFRVLKHRLGEKIRWFAGGESIDL